MKVDKLTIERIFERAERLEAPLSSALMSGVKMKTGCHCGNRFSL